MIKKLLCVLCLGASIQRVTALEKIEIDNIKTAGLFNAVGEAVAGAANIAGQAVETAGDITEDVIRSPYYDRPPIFVEEKEQIYRPTVEPGEMIEDEGELRTAVQPGEMVEDVQYY